jgi:hypothetical protein
MKSLIAALVLMPVQAQAEGIDMLPHYETPKVIEKVSHVTTKKAHKPKAKAKKKKTYNFRPTPPVDAPKLASDAITRCLSPVRVVGSQDLRPDAAEQSAIKAWAEMVRWTHGESYQDWQNASGYTKRCSRSSIGEALGQYFTRCEVSASPCRPGMIEGAK